MQKRRGKGLALGLEESSHVFHGMTVIIMPSRLSQSFVWVCASYEESVMKAVPRITWEDKRWYGRACILIWSATKNTGIHGLWHVFILTRVHVMYMSSLSDCLDLRLRDRGAQGKCSMNSSLSDCTMHVSKMLFNEWRIICENLDLWNFSDIIMVVTLNIIKLATITVVLKNTYSLQGSEVIIALDPSGNVRVLTLKERKNVQ